MDNSLRAFQRKKAAKTAPPEGYLSSSQALSLLRLEESELVALASTGVVRSRRMWGPTRFSRGPRVYLTQDIETLRALQQQGLSVASALHSTVLLSGQVQQMAERLEALEHAAGVHVPVLDTSTAGLQLLREEVQGLARLQDEQVSRELILRWAYRLLGLSHATLLVLQQAWADPAPWEIFLQAYEALATRAQERRNRLQDPIHRVKADKLLYVTALQYLEAGRRNLYHAISVLKPNDPRTCESFRSTWLKQEDQDLLQQLRVQYGLT